MKKLIALATLTLAVGCSDSKFKGGVTQAQPEPEPVTEDQEPVIEKVTKTLELKTTSTSVPVDMVWVVDNSGSMSEEVAQVRANIQSFVSSVGDKSDLRLSILSNEDRRLGLQFDSTMVAKDFLQLKSMVYSTNLLSSLAAAVCPADQFEGTQRNVTKICGKDVQSLTSGGLYEDYYAKEFAGALVDRMRPEAQKVFVFVSDDNSRGSLDATNFFTITGIDPNLTHIYAFVGDESRSGCNVANKGVAYKELATKSGGETFDICEADWSANFSKLTDHVKKLTSNAFVIPAEVSVKNIQAVKIGDTTLSAKQYLAGNGSLVVLDRSLLNEDSVVTIDYVIEESSEPKTGDTKKE